MFPKKIPVHTLHCVIKHPALHLGKISAHCDLPFFHLAVTVDGVLNGLASFLLSYSDRPVMHVVKEWDNVSPYSFGDNMFMVLHDNLVFSTGLIMKIGHHKEIRKLTFQALPLRCSELRNCGLSVVYIQKFRTMVLVGTW